MESLEEGRFARQVQMLDRCVCSSRYFFSPFLLCFKSSSRVPENMGQWMLMADGPRCMAIKHTRTQYFLSFFCNSEPVCLSLPPRYLINPQTFIPAQTKIAVTNGTHILFIR